MNKISVIKKNLEKSHELTPYEQRINNFNDLITRFFDDPWSRMPSFFNQALNDRSTSGSWWPKTDISETNKEIKIKINIPGVPPEKINIEADSNTLIISGSTEKEEEEKGENWYRVERESGEFRRSFELPSGCDIDNIVANTKHGSLSISVPKKPEALKKKIDIKING